MMILPIVMLLLGMVLGQRFKVLVLVPVMAFIVLVAIGAGVARGQGFLPETLMAVAAIAGLQIGFLAGIAINESNLFVTVRSSKLRTVIRGAQPVSRNVKPSTLEA